MALKLFLILVVLAISRNAFSKPSEDLTIKLNVDVNTDQGQTQHESVELVRDGANWNQIGAKGKSLDDNLATANMFMADTSDWGSCIQCARQNSKSLMRCVNKLRKGKDYIECFRDVAAKDQGDGFEVEKCATCSCKQLERMNIDVGKYPELEKMFCYLANEGDYCSFSGADESEHHPKCNKNLNCDLQNEGTDEGFCATEKCEDTSGAAVDKFKLHCENYELLNRCHKSDEGKDDDFEAKKMCCTCGGGSTPKGI